MMQPLDRAIPRTEERFSVREAEQIIPVYVEDVAVARRKVETAIVRVVTQTRTREHPVDETLTHERVEVERVPVGRMVDAAPAIREEGDLTIIPVVEEVVVVERRYLLKEEVHIRRVRTTEQHVETIVVREQEAVITRTPTGERTVGDAVAADTRLSIPRKQEEQT